MSRIFISYRRDDSLLYADMLQEDIGERYGPDEVFRDLDDIGPGIDFVQAIEGALSQAKVMLVLIGPKWLDPEGLRRLHKDGDYVRMEIATGLRRTDVHVIPVLVSGAKMPAQAELPEDVRSLSRRNAFEIKDASWSRDRQDLLEALGRILKPPLRWRKPAIVAAGVLAAAAAAVLLVVLLRDDPMPQPDPGRATPPVNEPTTTTPGETETSPPVEPGALAWTGSGAAELGSEGEQQMTAVVNPIRGAVPAFVAVGSEQLSAGLDAAVWTSADGDAWSRVDGLAAGGDQVMNSVTFVQVRETLVAGGAAESGGDRDAALWESTDGVRWTKVGGLREPGSNEVINAVNGTRLGVMAAGSQTGDGEDGAIWIDPQDGAPVKVSTGLGGRGDQRVNRVVQLGDDSFVAVGFDAGDAGVWVSDDGESWSRSQANPLDVEGEQEILDAVVVDGVQIVAVGRDGQKGAVWHSPNGRGWNRIPSREGVFEASAGAVRLLRVVASEDDARAAGAPRFLAGGSAGDEAAVWVSSNGITWRREPDSEGDLGGGEGAVEGLTAKRLPAVAVGWKTGEEGADAAVWLGLR